MTDYIVPALQLKYILITVLLLNLLFWSAVILWRIYILKRTRAPAREQRRAIQGIANPSMTAVRQVTCPPTSEPRGQRFVLEASPNDLPPSYDEAIKFPAISVDSQPALPHHPDVTLTILDPTTLEQGTRGRAAGSVNVACGENDPASNSTTTNANVPNQTEVSSHTGQQALGLRMTRSLSSVSEPTRTMQ